MYACCLLFLEEQMCFLTAVIANSLEQSMCTGNFRYLTGLCSIESGQMMTLLNNEPIFPIGLYKNFNIKKFKKKEKNTIFLMFLGGYWHLLHQGWLPHMGGIRLDTVH